MSSIASLVTPQALAIIAEQVKVRRGIASLVAPIVVTNKDRILHHRVSGALGFGLGANSGRHAWGTTPDRVPFNLSQISDGTLERYTLEGALDVDEISAGEEEGLDLKVSQLEILKGWHAVIREWLTASALFNTTTFSGATTTLSGVDLWSAANTCDPVRDISDAAELAAAKCGRTPEDVTIIVGGSPWNYLRKNPSIRDVVKRTEKAAVTGVADIAKMCGVKAIVPGTMKYNTTADGATESLSYVWGGYFLAAVIEEAPAPLGERGCAYTAVRQYGAGEDSTTWGVKMYQEGASLEVTALSQKLLLSVSNTYGHLVAVL